MSEANFTRGPWKFRSESGYCSQIDGADGSVICCFDEDPKPEDASLMESAPSLLEALRRISEYPEASTVAMRKIANEAIATFNQRAAQAAQGGE